jgi:hypothetical protein
MYESLSLEAKKFPGLTDEILNGLDKILGARGGIEYEQVNINFLQEDLEAFAARVKRPRSANRSRPSTPRAMQTSTRSSTRSSR